MKTDDVTGLIPTRREVSAAVDGLGWRFILGTLKATVRVHSVREAAALALRLAEVSGEGSDSLRMDIRPGELAVTLQSPRTTTVTRRELALAVCVADAVRAAGRRLDPLASPEHRSVQGIEIAIDALDIAGIRPFWKAVLGYADESDADGPEDPVVDPVGQGPAVWFQQMTAARPQRNRIHFDVSVPQDEAPGRLRAALDAGGVLVSEAHAPSFWVLADAEGNEACITTWQGRD